MTKILYDEKSYPTRNLSYLQISEIVYSPYLTHSVIICTLERLQNIAGNIGKNVFSHTNVRAILSLQAKLFCLLLLEPVINQSSSSAAIYLKIWLFFRFEIFHHFLLFRTTSWTTKRPKLSLNQFFCRTFIKTLSARRKLCLTKFLSDKVRLNTQK